MSGTKPLVQLQSVEMRLGQQLVLQDISLSLHVGDRLAIMGPSGAGKSTLLRILAGLEMPSAGTIQRSTPDLRVALMFQESALWPVWTIGQQWRAVLRARNIVGRSAKLELQQLAQRVQLPESLLRRRPEQLSGGQRQRAALGRCLAQDPQLLLLDEPFHQLDPPLTKQLVQLLTELSPEVTVVMVAHDQWEMAGLAQQAGFLQAGQWRGPAQLDEVKGWPECQPWFNQPAGTM